MLITNNNEYGAMFQFGDDRDAGAVPRVRKGGRANYACCFYGYYWHTNLFATLGVL